MGKYEDTMDTILEEAMEDIPPLGIKSRIVNKNSEDGFEFQIYCAGCGYRRFQGRCGYKSSETIRKVNGGEVNWEEGGKCFEFRSFDDFWDRCSEIISVDPDTGDVFNI
tara:strand:+ start:339 stop:665 length:327 start_codon:yes stop_codon:yes gene_type:complete